MLIAAQIGPARDDARAQGRRAARALRHALDGQRRDIRGPLFHPCLGTLSLPRRALVQSLPALDGQSRHRDGQNERDGQRSQSPSARARRVAKILRPRVANRRENLIVAMARRTPKIVPIGFVFHFSMILVISEPVWPSAAAAAPAPASPRLSSVVRQRHPSGAAVGPASLTGVSSTDSANAKASRPACAAVPCANTYHWPSF